MTLLRNYPGTDPIKVVDPSCTLIATDKLCAAVGGGRRHQRIVRSATGYPMAGKSQDEISVGRFAQAKEWVRKPSRQEIADHFT